MKRAWTALIALACLAPAQTVEDDLAALRRILNDWGGLTRYGSDNAEIKLKPGENRVVFLGDEITEMWGQGQASFFPGKPYFNRGIAHQTSAQMLVRFRQDVVNLKPKVVVIQAGLNDLAGYGGPATEGTVAENFQSLSDLARANNIGVVLAAVTPVCDCRGKDLTARRPAGKIISLNGWLKEFAARSGAVYLDYHAALVQGRAMRKDLTEDGLIPNDAGYAILAPLAEKAIQQALKGQHP